MTSPASFEIQIAAKRSPAIVTSRASVVATREVLLRARRTYLPFLRQPARGAVAVGTVQPLPRAMIRMRKPVTERDGIRRGSRVRLRFMTDSA